MRKLIACLLMLTLSTLQLGCSSTRSIPIEPEKAQATLESGDRVTIHLTNGDKVKGSIARVDDQGVRMHSDNFYPWLDIVRIEKTEFSAARSAGVGAIILATLAVIAIALFASSADNLGE